MSQKSNTNVIFTRQSLYDLVWSKPITAILKDFGISNSAFKNICRTNDIPLPKNGHWQKLKFNKKVDVVPLPELGKTYDEIKFPKKIEGVEDLSGLSELNLLKREINSDPRLSLKVPDKLTKPHPLVKSTKEYYSSFKKKNIGRLSEFEDGVLRIQASGLLFKRALLIYDTFIKALEGRGHDIVFLKSQGNRVLNRVKIVLYGEHYEISMNEKQRRFMEKHPRYDWKEAHYYPSGNLVFKIRHYNPINEWADTDNVKLENKIAHILAFIELKAKRDSEQRRINELRRQEYERQRKIQEDLKKIREVELRDFKIVLNQSVRWEMVKNMRSYIDELERVELKKGDLSTEQKEWFDKKRRQMNWFDPMIETEYELFSGLNPDDLLDKKVKY